MAERSAPTPGREIFLVDETGRAITHPDAQIMAEGADLSWFPPVQTLLSADPPEGISYGPMSDRWLAGVARVELTQCGVVSVRAAAEALAGDRLSRETVFIILWLAIVVFALLARRGALGLGAGVPARRPTPSLVGAAEATA